jgi:hypothetical protein
MKVRRVVWGGRASIYSFLYMATLSAICYNKPIGLFINVWQLRAS